MKTKDKKPWSPTVDQIQSMILASRNGYGITRQTIPGDPEIFRIIVFAKGKEEFAFEGSSAEDCFHLAYCEMVRKGKIAP